LKISAQQADRDMIFTWKHKLGKNTGRRERIHYGLKVTMNFTEYSCVFDFLDVIFLDECPGA